MNPKTILRLAQVMQRTGLSRSSIYHFVKTKKLKPPIRLGARAVGWLESDVDEFIEDRIKESRPDPDICSEAA